ncbi:MAG: sulfate ABC transporter permease subunit CysT [Methylacidiphilales bacterium]|nr:sulfate ABC transporter permease subunit CysT [Candidatus Methylacidiphilales bacterium]MDW8349479.1 sulfate ABC transporter permease subunit CysT [Verrucomicrobiae bacterium]
MTRQTLPGFHLTLGLSVFYLSFIALLPLLALTFKAGEAGCKALLETLLDPRVLAAFRLSFGLSLLATFFSLTLGLITAWVLVRYDFPGKRWADAVVDLPFALPTAVAGIALTSLYAPQGWFGRYFEMVGIKVAYTPLGIFIALVFISLPFVIRTVQPVIRELPHEIEEAAATLGSRRTQTFIRIILPMLFPSLLIGGLMGFGRALGEYGSVVFIAGNLPFKTEIIPLLIVTKLEQYDYTSAAVLGAAMLLASFLIMLCINFVQQRHATFTFKN